MQQSKRSGSSDVSVVMLPPRVSPAGARAFRPSAPQVQRLAGHADVRTTARYDRRGGAARRAAADLRPVPYMRRRL